MAFPKSLADVPSDASAMAYAFALIADVRVKLASAMQGINIDESTKEFVDDIVDSLNEHVDGIRRKIVGEHPEYRSIGSSTEPSEDESCALLLLTKSVEHLARRSELFKDFVSAGFATKTMKSDDYMERLKAIGEPTSDDVVDGTAETESVDDRMVALMRRLERIGT